MSIREQFDISTLMDSAIMFIISVFSQLERKTIAQHIQDNMHELAKTGRCLGGNAPTCFKSELVSKVRVEGKTREIRNELGMSKTQLVRYLSIPISSLRAWEGKNDQPRG